MRGSRGGQRAVSQQNLRAAGHLRFSTCECATIMYGDCLPFPRSCGAGAFLEDFFGDAHCVCTCVTERACEGESL